MNIRGKFYCIFFAMIVCLIFAANPSVGICSSDNILWTVEYNADVLPQNFSPPWEVITNANISCANVYTHSEDVSNGILTLSRTHGQIVIQNETSSLSVPSTLEIRMKVNYNTISLPLISERSAYLLFASDDPALKVNIFPDRVTIYRKRNSDLIEHYMDTTDTFHIYRFLLHENCLFSIYIDGVLIGKIQAPYCYYGPGVIRFGEGGTYCPPNLTGSAQSEWDYVRYYNGDAIPPNSDTDSDGILDDEDNCFDIPNSDQADNDGDGQGDACDDDDDNDGVPDDQDICPGGDDNLDADGDVVPDFCDACPNDSENDADGDGVCGDVDSCPGGDDNVNADGDSLPDFCDACPDDPENDADGDGICESDDNCPVISNFDQHDNDGDTFGDACDADDDNDNIPDDVDNCPLESNQDQADFDEDGAGDVCDFDNDNDGVLDSDDQCLFSVYGEIVNNTGCSIVDLCPCENPWKNHGAYVKCIAHTSEDFIGDGLITEAEKDIIVSDAAESNCGHKK